MNIRANSEKGFSLIELLVVVAIIGVLAAVGVVGYQGYIDSTKKSVTDANAKAVHQWLINTKTVRAAGIDVEQGMVGGQCADTHAQLVASLGHVIEISDPVSQFHRVVIRHQVAQRSELDGSCGQQCLCNQQVRRRAGLPGGREMLANPGFREPEFIQPLQLP